MTPAASALTLLFSLFLGHAAIATPLSDGTKGRLQIFDQERTKTVAELRALDAAPQSKETDAQKHRLREDLAALEREAARVRGIRSSAYSPTQRKEPLASHSSVASRRPLRQSDGDHFRWDVFRDFPDRGTQ